MSSLISLALDGIVLRMFSHEFETRAIHRLEESLKEVLQGCFHVQGTGIKLVGFQTSKG